MIADVPLSLHCIVYTASKYSNKIADMNCYSSETDTEGDFNDSMLAEGLMKWTNDFNIKHNALDELLKLLQKSGHRLPSSARSLLNSKRDVAVLQ